MSAGDNLQGRRLPDGAVYSEHVKPGDYALSFRHTSVTMLLPNDVFIRLQCSADGPVDAGTWGLTAHEDESVSLAPSIFLNRDHPDQPQWHGFLQHGVFREV